MTAGPAAMSPGERAARVGRLIASIAVLAGAFLPGGHGRTIPHNVDLLGTSFAEILHRALTTGAPFWVREALRPAPASILALLLVVHDALRLIGARRTSAMPLVVGSLGLTVYSVLPEWGLEAVASLAWIYRSSRHLIPAIASVNLAVLIAMALLWTAGFLRWRRLAASVAAGAVLWPAWFLSWNLFIHSRRWGYQRLPPAGFWLAFLAWVAIAGISVWLALRRPQPEEPAYERLGGTGS